MQHKLLQKFHAYKGSFVEEFSKPFEMPVPTIEETVGLVLDIIENDFNNITFQESIKNSFISTGMAPDSTIIFKKPEDVLKERYQGTYGMKKKKRNAKRQCGSILLDNVAHHSSSSHTMSDDEEFESDDEYFDEIEVDMRDNVTRPRAVNPDFT